MKTRIKELREDTDTKQHTLSKILNISQGMYSLIENEIHQADYQKLIKLALFYNTSIDDILNLTNQKLAYPRAKLSNKK